MRRKTSIGAEILWLLLWLVIFALVAEAMLKYVVPHHFNDRIAIMLAAIICGLIVIALRAWYFKRP